MGLPEPQETTDFAIWCSPCGVALDFSIGTWTSAATFAAVGGGLPVEGVSFEAQCGGDGCGGTCGTCQEPTECNDYFVCECGESSDTVCIGDESWSVDSCGQLAQAVASCQFGCLDGACQGCQPDCFQKACGPDGCGGSCGVCEGGLTCSDNGECAVCWEDSDCPTGDLCAGVGAMAMCVECIEDSDCKGANDNCVANLCESNAPPVLVINEVDYNTNQGEPFIELYNAGSNAISINELNQISLKVIDFVFFTMNYKVGTSYSLSNITDELPASGLASGAFVVFGVASMADDFANTITPFQTIQSNTLNTSKGGVALTMSSFGGTTIVLDTLQYGDLITSVDGNPSLPQWVSEGGQAPVDDGQVSNRGLSRCPNGGDTDSNSNDFKMKATTPGSANSCSFNPGPGDPKN